MKKIKENHFSFVLLFYLILILFLSATLFFNKVVVLKQAAGENLPPKEVTISNIASQNFTISWFTDKKTSGAVIYSSSKEAVEKQSGNLKTAEDTRGPATWSSIHYVNLESLNPGQNYYFAIISGEEIYYKRLDGSWNKDGLPAEQETANSIGFNSSRQVSPQNTEGAYSLEPGAWSPCSKGSQDKTLNPCFRPNLIWGETIESTGQKIKEALIFVDIPGNSTALSTLSNSQGKWTINLANFFDKELDKFLTYNPETDLLRIKSKESGGKSDSVYRLIPHVFAQDCLGLSPQDCQDTPIDKTNPVILTLRLLLSPTPSPKPLKKSSPPKPTLPKPTSTPTATPTPKNYLELKLRFRGISQKGPAKTALITFVQEGNPIPVLSQQASLESDEGGNYRGQINPVSEGIFTLFLKESYSLGKKVPSLEIVSGENLLDISGSPLITGDLNNDNRIDTRDLGILIGEFRKPEPQDIAADLNFDGQINGLDLGILISNYREIGE